MKKTILAFALTAVAPFAVAQELATYTISSAIEGMQLDGELPGVGDKSLTFTAYFDPTDADAAETFWYTHLAAIFGEEDQETLRALGRQLRDAGRR